MTSTHFLGRQPIGPGGRTIRRRVVVTGGAGFLGSHLCERLLERGYDVLCLDDLCTGSVENIEHLSDRPDFAFEHRDVIQSCTVNEPVHAVMHLASPASPIDYLRIPIETLRVGSLGTLNALGLAQSARAVRSCLDVGDLR